MKELIPKRMRMTIGVDKVAEALLVRLPKPAPKV
jgi:hypothetical protein